MTSKKKRPSRRPPRTAIVPRTVFATAVAVAVIPAASAIAGCSGGNAPATDTGIFSVAAPLDGGRDAGFGVADVGPPVDMGFSVAVPLDMGVDTGPMFGVADVGPPDAGQDAGFFGVAAPLDSGA
jgi:hypothetical protein